MKRTTLIESLESRQLYSVTSGVTAVSPRPVSLQYVTAAAPSAPAESGTVRPGEAAGFDPQPDPPALPAVRFSAVRI